MNGMLHRLLFDLMFMLIGFQLGWSIRHTLCERSTKRRSAFIEYPKAWPVHTNGGIPCDMLVGPCACGSWHNIDEWGTELRK